MRSATWRAACGRPYLKGHTTSSAATRMPLNRKLANQVLRNMSMPISGLSKDIDSSCAMRSYTRAQGHKNDKGSPRHNDASYIQDMNP